MTSWIRVISGLYLISFSSSHVHHNQHGQSHLTKETVQNLVEVELTGPGTPWKFKNNTNSSFYLPANTPSTFHLDLLDNNQVPDPYYRDNLLQFYMYEKIDWEYISVFTLDNNVTQRNVVNLVFEGLDTHTDIVLNGVALGSTNNTHRTWIFDVKKIIS